MLRPQVAAISILAITVVARVTAGEPAPRAMDVVGGVQSGRVVVQLKKDTAQRLARIPGSAAAVAGDPSPWLDGGFQTTKGRFGVTSMRPLYERPFSNPGLASQLGLDRVYVVEAAAGSDSVTIAQTFSQASQDVETAFADTIGGVALVPDDPDFDLQYAMDNTGQTAGGTVDADIDAVEAWSIHTGDPGAVTVAIVDSGVSLHVEFGPRLLAGRNTADPENPNFTIDSCPHGTHVAGIAAAEGNNGVGVAGVNWGANILPVRVLTGCNGPVSALAAGIVWAADNGADVLNMSLQYYNLTGAESANLQNAVNYAYSLGAVLVAAAGNNHLGGVGVVAYPARLANVLGISATTNADTLGTFSNFGPQVDLCAPGKDIWSTWVGNSYTYQFGTSMASPHVAGAVALMWSYEPALSRNQLVEVLLTSCDDLGAPGWDNQFGVGRLNAWRALSAIHCVFDGPQLEVTAPEAVPFAKCRAISFQPRNSGQVTALRVRLVSLHHPVPPYSGGTAADFSAFEGQYRWVGPPVEYVESESDPTAFVASNLQCTPHYTDWGSIALLHVLGAEVVPSSVYEVQSIQEDCSIASSSSFSAGMQVGTGRWGDVVDPMQPPSSSQQPDVTDISALVNKFRSAADAPSKARTMLAGQVPDLSIDLDFSQVSACVDAFRGVPYPFAGPVSCGP